MLPVMCSLSAKALLRSKPKDEGLAGDMAFEP